MTPANATQSERSAATTNAGSTTAPALDLDRALEQNDTAEHPIASDQCRESHGPLPVWRSES